MCALHSVGTSTVFQESVKAAQAERKKLSCRLLGEVVSDRKKRAIVARFLRWKRTAATVSAVIDAESSEADAKHQDDKGAG